MKRLILMALLLSQLCVGWCAAQTATVIYKNGKVEFGDFKKMTADSVFLETADNAAGHKTLVLAKTALSEVVFDSGDKLNLALTEFPTASTSSQASAVPIAAAKSAAPLVMTPSAASSGSPVLGSNVRNPFTYGGLSAVVPGLGQALTGDYTKGAICFSLVGAATAGSLIAWNSTTTAYNKVQTTKSANGLYNNDDYQRFTFRLHGAEILTCVSAVLYLLNIADATADAVIFNKQQQNPVKLTLSVLPSEARCNFAYSF